MSKAIAGLRKAERPAHKNLKGYALAFALIAIYITVTDLVFGTMCPLKLLTGIPCPACGISRAALLLVTKGPVAAAEFNACLYVWLAFALYAVLRRFAFGKNGLPAAALIVTIVVTVIYWIWRMGTMFPGNEPLAYHEKNLLLIITRRIYDL